MNKITLTVKETEFVKSGTKQSGEPYILSRVIDTQGEKYSTFLQDLVPGQAYDFLWIEEEFKGKDNKMHKSKKLVGFDNVAYEAKKERPAQNVTVNTPATGGDASVFNGFTSEDRRKLEAIYDAIVHRIIKDEPPF